MTHAMMKGMSMMEPTDPTFRLFHKYNKLVRRELAKPLTCRTCASPYITALGENDELVLKCLACQSIVTPGLDMIATVRAVVTEHFI